MKTLKQHLRIIGAIVRKDLLETLKNKTTLSAIFTMFFLVAFYRALPYLTQSAHPLEVALYDQGASRVVGLLESEPDVRLRTMRSEEDMATRMGRESGPVLGLVLPPDFDRRAEAGDTIALEGHVDHWVSDQQRQKLQTFYEEKLAALTGAPIRIEVHQGTIYTHPLGMTAISIALGMTLASTYLGLSVSMHLTLEEKEAHTLDALRVSPAESAHVVLAKIATGVLYSLGGAMLVSIFNAVYIAHWWNVALGALGGALFAAALGALLGNAFQSRQQATLWVFLLLQPLIIPVILPIFSDLIPEAVLAVTRWIPSVAVADTVRMAVRATAPLAKALPAFAVALLWSAALLAINLGIVRRKEV